MKTKILISVALLFAAFVFAGCGKIEKDQTTRVEGRILTLGTETPVTTEPITVELVQHRYETHRTVETTQTDQNGRFVLETTTNDKHVREYTIEVESRKFDLHYGQSSNYDRKRVDKGFQGTRDVFLAPHAWINFNFVNINPKIGDEFSFYMGAGIGATFKGPININHVVQLGGNNKRVVNYSLYRENQWTTWQDTIYATGFDTTFVKVEY